MCALRACVSLFVHLAGYLRLGKVDDMIELIKAEWVDVGMAKVVNQCFLILVYNNYWKLIKEGKLLDVNGPIGDVRSLTSTPRFELSHGQLFMLSRRFLMCL